jgi:hypothetical protein
MVEKNVATTPAVERERERTGERPPGERNPLAKMCEQEKAAERNREKIEGFDQRDNLLRQRAAGIMTEEQRDKLLALGEDVTRASPDPGQVLPDAEPGLTTTTGAYRTPIDPTTAAVPAPENSELVQRMQGAPTMGSPGHGQREELFKGPEQRPIIENDDQRQERERADRDRRERDRTDRARADHERAAERPAR